MSQPNPPIVVARALTKRFKRYDSPGARLSEWLRLGKRVYHTEFTALEDISFEVRKGEFFGIVGPNGSGKSTLLKVLTGVLAATSGSYSITGRITSLLELGTGFSPELTGRQNLVNSGRLLGFDEGQTRQQMEAIIDFAELGTQIDLPIKYYSTGMVVRLAFSLFAHIEPDVFIVDEALSVGDIGFSRKCFQRLDAMRESGCTLLFVSHDLAAVRKYCDHAMFLFKGRCAYQGNAIEATDIYLEAMSPGGKQRGLGVSENSTAFKDIPAPAELAARLPRELCAAFDLADFQRIGAIQRGRIGTGTVRVVAVRTTDDADCQRTSFVVGQVMRCHVLALVKTDAQHTTVSCQLVNRMGVVAWGTNHALYSRQTTEARAGQWLHAIFTVKLDLARDEYAIDVGWGDASGEGHVFDRITAAATINVQPGVHSDFQGLARLDFRTEVTTVDSQTPCVAESGVDAKPGMATSTAT